MRPLPMTMHIPKPTSVPSQTYIHVRVLDLTTIDRIMLTCLRSFLYTTGSCSGPNCCLRKERSTETMMTVSIDSRKTMKKTGTAKTFTILGKQSTNLGIR